MDRKHILVFAHYYTPDVASTGQILAELAEGLESDFDVTVVCTVPSYTGKIDPSYKEKRYYREEINGVSIIRVRVPEFSKSDKKSRIKNIVCYFFRALNAARKTKNVDIVFSISQPPILGGLLGAIAKALKRAKFVYNIQDYNPEQTIAVSYSRNKTVLKLMMALDKHSCRRADLVITVGRDLVETMNKRFEGKKVPKTVMINNWIDEKEISPLGKDEEHVIAFKERYGLLNKRVFMYSGNIGLYYDLENILKTISTFKDNGEVAFAFVGEGSVLEKLKIYKTENGLGNVVFIPYQDKKELVYSLNAADVHFCVNAKGIKGVSVPSKVYGIIAAQKPLLAVLEEGSEARLLIEETGCGIVADPGDYEGIRRAIEAFIAKTDEELVEMGRRGREYLEKNLTKEISIDKYRKALEKL